MAVPATSRVVRTFEDRADALSHFFQRAGEAPRLVAYDDGVGCPLDQALAALEWTSQVGVVLPDDLVHAGRLGPDSAAAVIERKDGDARVFIYFGPRMDAPPADPTKVPCCTTSPVCEPTFSRSGSMPSPTSCEPRRE